MWKIHALAIAALLFAGFALIQENTPPVIQIINPKQAGSQPLNTLIPFDVSIRDKQDGDSRYSEINGDEVYLSVRYLADVSKTADVLRELSVPDAEGFVLLQKSNCTTCHAFQGPLIGPSFSEIAKRYGPVKPRQTALAKHVVAGSSGVWGSVPMPSHPELTEDQAEQIIQWALTAARDTKTNYYKGLNGTMKLVVPGDEKSGGIFILRASYTDHGVEGQGSLQAAAVALVMGK